jgi:hypothetical protein
VAERGIYTEHRIKQGGDYSLIVGYGVGGGRLPSRRTIKPYSIVILFKIFNGPAEGEGMSRYTH